MATIRIHALASPAIIFQTVAGFFKSTIARSEKMDGNGRCRVTDERALDAFSRLDDGQLRDIGVIRRVRRVEWDTLARPLHPEKTVTFDYFRFDS